jgi:hypothetical protein
MSQAEKRLEAMRRNPVGDWTIADIEAVCRARGIDCVAPARGSHYDVSHPSQRDILTMPARRPLKPVYIRKFVTFVDAVEGSGRVRP